MAHAQTDLQNRFEIEAAVAVFGEKAVGIEPLRVGRMSGMPLRQIRRSHDVRNCRHRETAKREATLLPR